MDAPLEGIRPGSIIQGYRVQKLLGSGSFGVVYEAAAPDGSLVALKLMLNRCGPHASLDDVLLVENEAAALSELQHPHIAQLLNTVRLANGTLLVMELARGGDLRTFLEQQRGGLLSPLLARDFVKQLARGIRHAHNLKIIHRDLKLDNVLLDASQTQLRIADFGLSHAAKGEARLGVAGSLYYMAPEFFTRTARDGAAVDIWALGVIAYTLLAGRLPFCAEVCAEAAAAACAPLSPPQSLGSEISSGSSEGGDVGGARSPSASSSLDNLPSLSLPAKGSTSQLSTSPIAASAPTWWAAHKAAERAAPAELVVKQVRAAIARAKPPPLPEWVPPAAAEAVELMLCADASKRPTAAVLLRHAWFTGSSGSGDTCGEGAAPAPRCTPSPPPHGEGGIHTDFASTDGVGAVGASPSLWELPALTASVVEEGAPPAALFLTRGAAQSGSISPTAAPLAVGGSGYAERAAAVEAAAGDASSTPRVDSDDTAPALCAAARAATAPGGSASPSPLPSPAPGCGVGGGGECMRALHIGAPRPTSLSQRRRGLSMQDEGGGGVPHSPRTPLFSGVAAEQFKLGVVTGGGAALKAAAPSAAAPAAAGDPPPQLQV